MKVTVSASGHPAANNVRVRCMSIDAAEAQAGFGEGIRFTFETIAGEHKGCKSYRTISAKITPGNAAGQFVAQALGLETLPLNADVDLDDLIGGTFVANIVQSPKGSGTRVESLTPLTAAATPKPAPVVAQPEGDCDIPF